MGLFFGWIMVREGIMHPITVYVDGKAEYAANPWDMTQIEVPWLHVALLGLALPAVVVLLAYLFAGSRSPLVRRQT
jgi:hypothetical protein